MVVKNLFIISLVLLFTSCTSLKRDVQSALQTNSATLLKKNQESTREYLIKFKKKLDKRNPRQFNKNHESNIINAINYRSKKFYIRYENKILYNYKDYLELAFNKNDVKNRNDYLILGIYHLLHESYNLDKTHKFSTFSYDKEKLDKLYKNLQIIKWKIKVARDINDKYLFLTWQNNWQIELEKRIKSGKELNYSDLKDLKYIKGKKESLLSSSNFSFEVLLTQMIDNTKSSLESIGEEPKELAMKAMFFFI